MNDNQNIKQRAFGGIVWKLSEKVGMQAAQFAIQIVLARLLMPEDYGLVGLLSIFIAISDVFVQQGFTTALIQKKNADELDYSSVFYANVIISIFIYIVLYILSPFIADFYHEPKLTAIMRVLCLNVIIGALCAVHNSLMAKKLDFKKSFFRNLSNIFTQGVVGITMAYMGYGVWALVFSKLSGVFVGTLVLCITVKWIPRRMFSFRRLKNLFSYSSKILVTNLLNTVFNNIHSLIIGRFFSKADVGYYQRGQQIPQMTMGVVDGSLNEVMYPTMSLLQDDLIALKNALRRSMKLSMFIVLPMLCGLIAIAEPVVLILLTEKWLPCVPFMQLSCIICAFWPLSARTHALNALGKSNITFKLSIISKSLILFFAIVCIRFGIYAIMIGSIITAMINVWISSYYISKYIKYSIKEFIFDLLPIIVASVLMLLLVTFVGLFINNIYIKLLIQIAVGVVSYIILAKLFKIESMQYLVETLKEIISKRKKNINV